MNLRILQYSLSYLKKICHIVFAINSDMDICESTLCDVLNSILRVAIRSRVAKGNCQWCLDWTAQEAFDNVNCLAKDDELNAIDSDNSFRKWYKTHFFSFRFVHNYVQSGIVNYDEINNDLSEYINRKVEEKSMANDPYIIAYHGWWNLTEQELNSCIEKIEKKFQDGFYSAHMCIRILHLLLLYSQELDFMVGNPDELFGYLKDAVLRNSIPMDLDYDNFHTELDLGGLSDSYMSRFNNYISELRGVEQAKRKDTLKSDLNHLGSADWSNKLSATVSKNKQEFKTRKSFLALFYMEGLLGELETATGADYSNLLKMFRSVYSFSNLRDYFSADIPNLESLIEGMRKMTSGDKMIHRCRRYVRQFLEEQLANIKS